MGEKDIIKSLWKNVVDKGGNEKLTISINFNQDHNLLVNMALVLP